MTTDQRIDETLRVLSQAPTQIPPLGPPLEAELNKLQPVTTRRPLRQLGMVMLASLLYSAIVLIFVTLRPDIGALPLLWLVIYCLAWLSSFVIITYLVMIPGPGRIIPNWRYAGIGALVASLGFVGAGLLFARSAPGVSLLFEPSLHHLMEHSEQCVILGTTTALIPTTLGALLVRGTLPVGSRWAGAGLGAAGGSLGGLLLHLHCPIADALHLGMVHGGVVLLSAVVGALISPSLARK